MVVKYGKTCKYDAMCDSGICEMTYTDTGRAIGRKCVVQEQIYGKKCRFNKDCVSGRCVETVDENGNFIGMRCKVIKGEVIPPAKWPIGDDDLPEELRASESHNEVRKEEIILSNVQKRKAFQGRGPVSEFIVLVMEIVIQLVAKVVDILWIMWKEIFRLVYKFTFGFIQFHKIFGWWTNYTCFDVTFFRYFFTLLFPPLGVFMKKGIAGFGYILLCCILTMLFYFPGLVYAIIVMTDGELKCPNKLDEEAAKK